MSAAQVWIVDLDLSPGRLDRCSTLLDSAECRRADRFVRSADRARFVASHAALRLILGEALGLAPAGLQFDTGPAGKPDLAGAARGGVTFNLSHSGARALIGLAQGRPIGVDVEAVRTMPDALRIARAHFSADEVSALADTPRSAVERVFFGLWTRKEAVVKALGSGLSLPLDRFSVSVPPARPRLLRMPGGDPQTLDGSWSLADVDCGADHAATVAVRSAEAAIALRRLPDDWPDQLR
ncbi:4'-phosphopantetheinyl transferase family protein [Methylobacterium sp. P5_C11]